MASSAVNWIWSAPHNNYYYVTYGTDGTVGYHWAENQLNHVRADSGNGDDYEMPAPVARETRAHLPNFIAGTPEQGWYDQLDSSYFMRTGAQAKEFFKKGRVFAMLYSESSGGQARRNPNDDAFTVVRFNETAYTTIRRFVIISVRKNFIYACGISTYSGRGTLKPGCNAREHAVIYNTGINPETCYLEGEKANGLCKEPIEVWPADSGSYLKPRSRIRFGKAYSIEWNVKVKDIGKVMSKDMSKLLSYYQEEDQEMPD